MNLVTKLTRALESGRGAMLSRAEVLEVATAIVLVQDAYRPRFVVGMEPTPDYAWPTRFMVGMDVEQLRQAALGGGLG